MNKFNNIKAGLLILFVISFTTLFGQDRISKIETDLNNLSKTVPALNETVTNSISGTLQTFLRAVANKSNLNITVDPTLDIRIVNNFSNVRVADILVFLCKEYELDLRIFGSIVTISKYEKPLPPVKPYVQKKLKIDYNKVNDNLSLELDNDTLSRVAKEITQKSNKNIVLAPGLSNNQVSAFIQDMPFDNVMEKFAFANNLKVNKSDDGFYLLEKKEEEKKKTDKRSDASSRNNRNKKGKSNSDKSDESELNLVHVEYDSLVISSVNTSISEVVKEVSDQLDISYFMLTEMEEKANMNVNGIGYEELLSYLFTGTEYAYSYQEGIYLFGKQDNQDIRAVKVIPIQYRRVDSVPELIPEDLKENVTITEFVDLNSVIVTGPLSKINIIEKFIREIDKVVPVILIEVIIAESTKSYQLEKGIKAGVGPAPASGQTIFPNIDFTLSTETINNLISSFNGFGWFNLGKVTPDFYMSIKALEDNSILKLKSTPKLSTLNGKTAELTNGETRYYYEEQTNINYGQSTTQTSTKKWTPVEASLKIKITPYVSGDGQITLNISVEQAEFQSPEFPGAPPGNIKRNFKSVIRVKDQEMVLLGGIIKKSQSDVGTGVPFLSRVPVIKWIFSNRRKASSETKLNIFIKPTVFY